MSTWNYRIIHHDKDERPWFAVHEVFYNPDQTIYAYTEDPIDIVGDTDDDVKKSAKLIFMDVIKHPVLKESEIVIVDNGDILDFDDEEQLLLDEAALDDFFNTLEDSTEIK